MLFNVEFPKDNSPEDTTEIKQMIFHYSAEEYKLFKRLAKRALKAEYPEDFTSRNVPDLRRRHGAKMGSAYL